MKGPALEAFSGPERPAIKEAPEASRPGPA